MLIKGRRALLRVARELSGDNAYERYLQHHASAHPERIPLSRKAFFKQQQARKWNQVNRCC